MLKLKPSFHIHSLRYERETNERGVRERERQEQGN